MKLLYAFSLIFKNTSFLFFVLYSSNLRSFFLAKLQFSHLPCPEKSSNPKSSNSLILGPPPKRRRAHHSKKFLISLFIFLCTFLFVLPLLIAINLPRFFLLSFIGRNVCYKQRQIFKRKKYETYLSAIMSRVSRLPLSLDFEGLIFASNQTFSSSS